MTNTVEIGKNLLALGPMLEPIAGVAFALNLAYLGLPRFRYRETIKDATLAILGDLADKAKVPEHIKEIQQYKGLMRLASLSNTKKKWYSPSAENGDLTGWWSTVYEWLFECQTDRFLMVTFAFLANLILVLGVMHNTSHSMATNWFSVDNISYWIAAVVILQALPVMSVLLGNAVTKRAIIAAEKFKQDIAKLMQSQVEQAVVPTLHRNQNPQIRIPPNYLPPGRN